MEEVEQKVRTAHEDCGKPLSGQFKLYTEEMKATIHHDNGVKMIKLI